MKTHLQKFLTSMTLLVGLSVSAFAISYTSAGVGPVSWNNSATWSPAGIPTNADDVTIALGHTVLVDVTGCICKNLTVAGTLNLTSNTLGVRGNYTVTGAETGSASILFNSTTTATINITGSSSSTCGYSLNTNVIIPLGSTINKGNAGSASVILAANKTMTNSGSCTFGTFTGQIGSTFINSTNAVLVLRKVGFMAGRTFDASATGNSVSLLYSTGAVPTSVGNTFYNLSLAAAVAGSKTLAANTIVLNNLSISTNNTLNSNSFNLTVGRNWTSNGTFIATTGKRVTFNGTLAQTVSNTVGTTTFKELAISNNSGVTLTTGTYILDEVLDVTAGTFNTGGRPFTMTSNSTLTARIAPLGATAAIAGNFTIQRFITARDTSFADLSSPVQSSTFADWESELVFINYVSNPPSSQASAATYDEVGDAYVPVTSSATAISPGTGYEVFLTGGYTYSNFPATTITTVGTPNQGDFDLSSQISSTVQGWNLVGNPFASSIAWSSIYAASGGASSGLFDYIEMYDYTIADWNGYTSADAIEVGATQGFWVYGNFSGTPTLLIPESSKTTASNSSIKSAVKKSQHFNLKLSNTATKFAHTFKLSSSETASDGIDPKDIPFRNSLNTTTPEMYCIVDGKKININTFNSLNESYSIPLKTRAFVTGSYKIEASGFEFLDYTCFKLQDNLTGQTIDITEGNGYCFTMNTNESPDRFVLLLSKDSQNCKSAVASGSSADFSNEVEILPAPQGNVVNFNLSETTITNISVLNVLGQTVVEPIHVDASNQSVNVALPEGFSGLYFIQIESSKGTITKKFVRK